MASEEEIKEAASDALLAQIESGAASYSIGNRSVQKINLKDLLAVQRDLAFEADRQANGVFRLAKRQKTSGG